MTLNHGKASMMSLLALPPTSVRSLTFSNRLTQLSKHLTSVTSAKWLAHLPTSSSAIWVECSLRNSLVRNQKIHSLSSFPLSFSACYRPRPWASSGRACDAKCSLVLDRTFRLKANGQKCRLDNKTL